MSNRLMRDHIRAPKFKTALLAGAAVMAMTTAALAQDVTSEDDAVIVLDPISIDAKADVVSGGVQLESDDLDRIDPTTIRDVFRQEPSVTVSSPIALSQQIHVNGIEDTNLNVDFDGARQANKTYHHIGTTVYDPSMLKAVKVETGVAPADAGPNALAGTISMETKDGRDFVAPGEKFGGFAKLSYNTNGQRFSEDVALATRYEGLDVMLFGTKSNSNNYDDADANEVVGSRDNSENFLIKTGFSMDNGYRLKVTANRFEDDATRPPRPDFAFPRSTQSPTKYTRGTYTASFGNEKPSDMWDPKVTLAHTNTDLKMHVPDFGNTPREARAAVKTWNGKASNTFTTELGEYTVGADFFADRGNGGFRGFRGTEKAYDYGAFTQARLSWSEDLRTSLGARFDYSKLEGMDASQHSGSGFSGNANVEYDLTNEFMLYGGASSVFGGYQLGEVALFGGNGGTTVSSYDTMRTSRSSNFKIGTVYELGGFSIDGNWYSTRINDANDLGSGTSRDDQQTINSRGFNLSARYNYEDGFARIGFSSNNTRINSGYLAATSADYYGIDTGESINFEVSHTLRSYNLTLGSTNEAMLADNSQKGVTGSGLDGYLVSNFYTQWLPESVDGLSVRFDVTNLFDHQYTNRVNAGTQTTNANISPFYEPGRSFILTAKYDF